MIGKTVWMLIIYWSLVGDDAPQELWRIQQPAKTENCAQMTFMAKVGKVSAITVQCNAWNIMRPKEGDEK